MVPVRNCLLQDSRLNEVAEAVLLAARRCRLTAYDEDRGSGLLRHMVLRRGVRTGQVSVTLVTPTSFFPGSRNFVRLLTAQCPDVVTVVQNINPRHTSAVLGSAEKLLYGKGYLEDLLCGKRFAIRAARFLPDQPGADRTAVQHRPLLCRPHRKRAGDRRPTAASAPSRSPPLTTRRRAWGGAERRRGEERPAQRRPQSCRECRVSLRRCRRR